MDPHEIFYQGHRISVQAGETVLEALERSGHQRPASCRSGVCQTCVMKVIDGAVPAAAQNGLKPSWKQQGYFLPCVCKPTNSMHLVDVDAFGEAKTVHLIEAMSVGADVKQFRFQRPPDFHFHAGQFLTFCRDDGLSRSYSIASLPTDAHYFDIHVRKVMGGQMSTWLHDEAMPGTALQITGPKGDCFYQSETGDETLVLVGLGTGIAPLYAIAQQALLENHRGTIHIIQGAMTSERLYLVNDWQLLAGKYRNVSYRNSVLQASEQDDEHTVVGDISALLKEILPVAPSTRLYLCGDAGMVQRLKKQAFLLGVSMKHIFADPFVGHG